MSALKGAAVLAQSGGPTAVINSSIAGAVEECFEHSAISGIYGSLNGILGVLREELFDLRQEDREAISGLVSTPSAALGSCRYKLKSLEESREDYERILEVFKAHDVRYFFYAGGNDSMDTADKLGGLAAAEGYELRVMGIPKTIDNDLAHTDHSPGYGSVAKFLATSVMEAGRDTEALYTSDTVTVLETMGRNAGWIAGSTCLARREEEDAPHLVYLPEAAFTVDKFIADVDRVITRFGRCFIVSGEGLKDDKGEYVTFQSGDFSQDSFGHVQLGGVAEFLKNVVETKAGVKCRYIKQGTAQRNARHWASGADVDEAYRCGQAAARLALEGQTGLMVTLERESESPYKCATGTAKLYDVANDEKFVPRDWINEEGNFVTERFLDYARPLIQGEPPVPVRDGLPDYVRLKKNFIDKRCRAYDP
jgi:6-phosphofructokinase 1